MKYRNWLAERKMKAAMFQLAEASENRRGGVKKTMRQ